MFNACSILVVRSPSSCLLAKAFGVAFCELITTKGETIPTKHAAFAYYGGQARNDAKHKESEIRSQRSESL